MFRIMDGKDSLQQTIQAYRAAQNKLKMQLQAFFASLPYQPSQVVKLIKSGMLNDQSAMQEAKQMLAAIEKSATEKSTDEKQKTMQADGTKRLRKNAARKTLQV